MRNKSSFYINPSDIKAVLKDLGHLRNSVTTKTVIRRTLMASGSGIKKAIEVNASNAIGDGGKISNSFAWRQGTKKKGYLSMFIRSIPNKGGRLTTIFENGTTDRYHKNGWWTGKIEDGMGKTSGRMINTKFIQRGFDSNAKSASEMIVAKLKIQVTKVVSRSRILNNKTI